MKYTDAAKVHDWNDTWYQLKALITHDIAKPYNGSLAEAAKIVQAKMTIIVEKQDHLCSPAPATEFSKLLPARLIVLDGESGHVGAGLFDDPALVKGIQDELSDIHALGVSNQNLFDTIPFIPEHTPARLAQFAKEPVVQGKVIFLGNSITEMGNWKKVVDGGYTYIDIFHLFVDADGHLMSQYTYEGLHLKPPAYDVWVDYLKKQGYL